MVKFIHEEVKDYITNKGLTPKLTKYNEEKLEMKYLFGNQVEILLNNFLKNQHCEKCSNTEKLTYEKMNNKL